MRTRALALLVTTLAFASVGAAEDAKPDPKAAAKPKTDLASADKRRVSVDLARQLTRPPHAAKLPDELPEPFNPEGFDQIAADERPPAPAPTPTRAPKVTPGSGESAAPVAPTVSDRELLETLAAKLPATATAVAPGSGERLLFFGRNKFKVGDHFVVNYAPTGLDYDLELAAIDSTTFTIRYRNQETTRPIVRSGKQP
ncbi:MAG: hypothetical protein RLZZ15_3885 [Verrucomicrobiota bacterium]|jgi:hypothetical protein